MNLRKIKSLSIIGILIDPKDSDKEPKGMNQHYGNITVDIWTANFNKVRNIDITYVNDFITRLSVGEIEIPLEQFKKVNTN